ncbi:transcriptional regulator [Actinocorallia sp. A-T 12471]|uniref:transcriptional regulator n=1 Tax=Actinocorallia sp. A-T 12471 TaxID=3089813 RepID=UPI0029D1DA77|nr:transcriptional regulator [Actinocorallia sp. A-T 12471]MDX6742028.1 transcriptional regulator [Actinocorallia sp. A-T 12471]
MTGPRTGAVTPDLTIGVVGPHDLVERVMLMGHGPTPVPSRLVAAAYRDEQEAADKVMRLGSGVDVCLFASPVPYDFARKAGVLTMPATYVPLNGAALQGALLRAALDERFDPAKVSIDVLARGEVEEAYGEIGLAVDQVHLREEVAGPGTLAAFHERLWRRGVTSVALTCVHATAERMELAGVPTLRIRPTGAAIRSALQTAALLGAHHRLEESQLVVVLVDVPTLRESPRRVTPRYWREELKLALHRVLLQEAHRMNAAVWPLDDHSYLVTATRGSVASGTEGFRTPPFVERVREELGLAVEVGIGMGRTAQEAEAHARAALARSQTSQRSQGFALDRDGRALVPAPRIPSRGAPPVKPKGLEILARLADRLGDQVEAGAPLIVDAENAGKMLGVTSRTARRLLRTLVEEGLAWPLPPNRTPQPGRPRQLYRLIVEKLGPAKTGS